MGTGKLVYNSSNENKSVYTNTYLLHRGTHTVTYIYIYGNKPINITGEHRPANVLSL